MGSISNRFCSISKKRRDCCCKSYLTETKEEKENEEEIFFCEFDHFYKKIKKEETKKFSSWPNSDNNYIWQSVSITN